MTAINTSAEYAKGYQWGSVDIAQIACPLEQLRPEFAHVWAAEAHRQAEEAGMSEIFCQGAHDGAKHWLESSI